MLLALIALGLIVVPLALTALAVRFVMPALQDRLDNAATDPGPPWPARFPGSRRGS